MPFKINYLNDSLSIWLESQIHRSACQPIANGQLHDCNTRGTLWIIDLIKKTLSKYV